MLAIKDWVVLQISTQQIEKLLKQLCRGGTVTTMVISTILGTTVIGGRLLRMIAITLGNVTCTIITAMLTGTTTTRITDTQCAALGILLKTESQKGCSPVTLLKFFK
ncbi:MAG: hypothetical protein M0P36_02000 [Bacteroidales bacterium]|nr:hypothetical protein [Bacteroidales bacterium]